MDPFFSSINFEFSSCDVRENRFFGFQADVAFFPAVTLNNETGNKKKIPEETQFFGITKIYSSCLIPVRRFSISSKSFQELSEAACKLRFNFKTPASVTSRQEPFSKRERLISKGALKKLISLKILLNIKLH